MERLRILAAAVALGEFRADELCVFSGAKAETVRSVLRRDHELFEVISRASDGRPGRPAKRYRVKDAARIREEIRELERAVAPAGTRIRAERVTDTEEDQLVAIASAEDAILDSWRADDPGERVVLTRTALAALTAARRMMPEDLVPADEPLQRRSRAVEVFARIADAEAGGELIGTDDLHQAAVALSDLTEVAPERSFQFLVGLSATAVRNHQSLPLAFALTPDERLPASIAALAGDPWVEAAPLAQTDYVLWSQRWAAPLAEHRLFAGTVLPDHGEESLDAPLLGLMDWQVPTVVLSERHSPEVVRIVSEAGAFFLPPSAGMHGIARTMVSAFRHRGYEGVRAEEISFDFGAFDLRR